MEDERSIGFFFRKRSLDAFYAFLYIGIRIVRIKRFCPKSHSFCHTFSV